MKCQSLLARKNKKSIIKVAPVEFFQKQVKVDKYCFEQTTILFFTFPKK